MTEHHGPTLELTRRGLLTTVLVGAAAVSLPAWPASAQGTGDDTSGAPVLDTHPATEPSGTHVRRIGDTNVVFAYGTVLPSFEGWNTREKGRHYLSLEGRWRFAFDPHATGLDRGWHRPGFDDQRWDTLAVPSSWDLDDTPGFGTLDGENFGEGTAFADGYAWYRRTFTLNGPWLDQHLRLNFLAAGYSAEVWVDGIHLGKHEGASGPFSLAIPARRRTRGRHSLVVRVFRRASYPDYATGEDPISDELEVPYKPVDYWPYAGLTRTVWLEGVAPTSITKVLLAGVGDRLIARVVVENHGRDAFVGTVQLDPGRASRVSPVSKTVRVAASTATVVAFDLGVSRAPRWSPSRPTMITAQASLHTRGDRHHRARQVDQLTATYGLRDLAVSGSSLQLDGTDLFLKGMSWHEETAAHGRSMTVAEYDTELGHVTDLGANFIRNCVYTRHPYVYDWADRHGVMVMDDIDTMWLNTAQEKLQTEEYGLCRAMALTMAWNQHNHPSVILWGLENESEIDPDGAPVYRAWLADLKAAVKSVDLSQRPVTWSSSTTADPAFDIADVIGINEYFGYFYGQSAQMGPAMDQVHAAYPDKPILITENGTYSIPGQHGPATEAGNEEWQAEYIADHWDQVVERQSFMCGYTLWVLKDHKERNGYNQAYNGVSVLGLLTFDTEDKKVAYGRFRGLTS